MTSLTNIDLTTLNLKSLQSLAKEFKVKSWWTLKKADLISELTNIKLDLEDKAAVQKATEEYQEELKESSLADDEEYCHYCGTRKKKGFLCPECGRDWETLKNSENSTQSSDTKPTEKKVSKKSPKTPKTPKANKVEKNEENLVTLKELAAEFHMKGTKARRLLRDAAISRPYGGNRWEWDKNLHIDELNMAREYLKAHTKAPKKEQDK